MDFGVLQHLVEASALDVEDLAANWEDRLGTRIAGGDSRTTSGVAFNDEQFAFLGIATGAIFEFVGHAGAFERGLTSCRVASVPCGEASPCSKGCFPNNLASLGGILFKPVAEKFVRGFFDQRTHGNIAQLAFGLAFELWIAQFHRNDCGQTLTNVVAGEVFFLLFKKRLCPGVLVHHIRDGLFEAFFVHAAFDGGNAVCEGVHPVGVEASVPLEGDFDFLVFFGLFVVADLLVQRFFRRVQVANEVNDAALVFEDDWLGMGTFWTFVLESNLKALIKKGHHLKALEQGLRSEDRFVENGGIGPETNRGAGSTLRGLAANLKFGGEFPAVGEVHVVAVVRVVDLDLDSLRQCIHDGNTHAMQTAGNFVTGAAEFAARVEHGENDLGRAHALHLRIGMFIDRNASAVVDDFATPIGQQRDFNTRGMSGHCFIDRVVDDLIDQMMQARWTGRTDIHAGSFAHRLETLEDRDVFCAVLFGGFRHALGFPLPGLRRWIVCVTYTCNFCGGFLLDMFTVNNSVTRHMKQGFGTA